MRVTASLKFDGYKGKTAKVRLMRDDKVIEEREVPVPQENHREEVRFTTVPEEGGVGGFFAGLGAGLATLAIAPVVGVGVGVRQALPIPSCV